MTALVILPFALPGCGPAPGGEPLAGNRIDTLAFVGGAVCAGCHAEAAKAWAGSDHDLAMTPAVRPFVLGDFEGASFTDAGLTTRFSREGDKYFVETEGPTGVQQRFEVQYTFGYRPLQQYLVPTGEGRLQALTVAWDTDKGRWFSLYPGERFPPKDFLHWTGAGMNWNYMCAECHSTDLRKNFDLATNTYHTSFAEIDVSCEACHGPGEAHVRWAESPGSDAYRKGDDAGLTVDLSDPRASRRQIETCAPCHSRRRTVYPGFRPGEAYLDHYEPALLEDDLYYADGQIKDEVYVYGSFLQSKMYANGVRCTDCHDPHSTRVPTLENTLCTKCHAPATYDTFAHIRHAPGTDGSRCVDCHMPERTYMVVDPRRDHSFRVPRPDLSARFGTPNACTGCHANESAEWAAEWVQTWFGPTRTRGPAFTPAFAAARARTPGADRALAQIVGEKLTPAIVRATALYLLDRYDTAEAAATARAGLRDPENLVRLAALRSVGRVAPERAYELAAPLLTDSFRVIRMEAAQLLARTAADRLGAASETETAKAFAAALAEYQEGQRFASDQAAAHLNLAVTAESMGNLAEAEADYHAALRLDSSFIPAHVNLAMLFNRRREAARAGGRVDEEARYQRQSEAALRSALRQQPGLADLHYTLGLLLAEQPDRLGEAAAQLESASDLAPQEARIAYNAGLAFQQTGRPEKAERLLLRAYLLEPGRADYVNAMSIFYAQQERWTEAIRFTEEAVALAPADPALQQRLAFLRSRGATTR